MIYVALLRGINVGGKNKVDMKQLKVVFEQAGMNQVRTYINSGNIIFSHEKRPHQEIVAALENAIKQHFELSIKVLIRNIIEMQAVLAALPEAWQNNTEMKSDVLFLWEDIDEEHVLEKLTIKPDFDRVIYIPGAILWSVDRKNAAKSGLSRIIGTALYQQVTIRNVNTTRKIYHLMEQLAAE